MDVGSTRLLAEITKQAMEYRLMLKRLSDDPNRSAEERLMLEMRAACMFDLVEVIKATANAAGEPRPPKTNQK